MKYLVYLTQISRLMKRKTKHKAKKDMKRRFVGSISTEFVTFNYSRQSPPTKGCCFAEELEKLTANGSRALPDGVYATWEDIDKPIDEKEDEAQGKKGYEKKVRGKLKNVIVRRKNGKYLVEVARLFETIPQLIKHYRQTPGKLNKTKGCSDIGKAKIKEMMKEARLMRNFRHRNVVRIYGVAVDEQPLYIILELVSGWLFLIDGTS
ncbi:hypothetical protein ANCCEY_13998 [Ancylostoma ceylanicum]|uniref:Serine-threonine/tyrosine-protein kinase catalytic domain-containing protein n=1 Tax=Ancylostoma ceylanicum TaxID=53326 RepID=A0A0D6L6A2_9BILA|nr:hypothetical protein ANCCEY_13998 [Ancylostoma ceylanicum]